MQIKVGDLVELTIDSPFIKNTIIKGKVTSVFDALTKEGESGINLEIDIAHGLNNQLWFRYKPAIDGGSLKIIGKKNE